MFVRIHPRYERGNLLEHLSHDLFHSPYSILPGKLPTQHIPGTSASQGCTIPIHQLIRHPASPESLPSVAQLQRGSLGVEPRIQDGENPKFTEKTNRDEEKGGRLSTYNNRSHQKMENYQLSCCYGNLIEKMVFWVYLS